MNTAELKLQIFRKIDSLEKSKLQEIYGILINYINGEKDESDWKDLTKEQRQGILNAISELDSGKGIPHDKVIAKLKDKYPHV